MSIMAAFFAQRVNSGAGDASQFGMTCYVLFHFTLGLRCVSAQSLR